MDRISSFPRSIPASYWSQMPLIGAKQLTIAAAEAHIAPAAPSAPAERPPSDQPGHLVDIVV